ncbi:MAG: helix-turn-helix domain-containing protein [Opitutaceae bacterium]|nr:helix-turn-helix domain-containing protein [Opitutaceae bacterium]
MNPFNFDSFRKLSDLRAQLEAFAARHAAARAMEDAAGPRELKAILARLESSTRRADHGAFRNADASLHRCIIRMADVPLLEEAWGRVWEQLAGFHARAFKEYFPDLRTLTDEHEYLVATITRADPVAAEDAARSHVEAVWLRVAEKQAAPDPESDQLQRTVAHMVFRMRAPLRLQKLARTVAFTSAGNLSRLFRSHYGVGFQRFLQNLRLEKAAELLTRTSLPVGIICQRVGYRDASRFSQHFSRKFGRGPLAWRKQRLAPPRFK